MRTPTYRITAGALALCGALSFAGAALADAKTTVEAYHEHLIGAVTAPTSTSDRSRFDALAPAMDAAFDFEGMIKTAAGRYWRAADAATKAEMLKAFRRVSIATYADQFAGLGHGKFNILATRDGPRGLKLVDSRLKSGDSDVALTYVVREIPNGWQIIDVLLDSGISELALRASEYAKVLQDGGAPALIATLNTQADNLLKD